LPPNKEVPDGIQNGSIVVIIGKGSRKEKKIEDLGSSPIRLKAENSEPRTESQKPKTEN
jgi:hypothetical protein